MTTKATWYLRWLGDRAVFAGIVYLMLAGVAFAVELHLAAAFIGGMGVIALVAAYLVHRFDEERGAHG